LQPFTQKTVLLYLIGIIAYGVSLLLPAMPSFIVDIILRSMIITVAFLVPVYYFNISEDINKKIDATMKKILGR